MERPNYSVAVVFSVPENTMNSLEQVKFNGPCDIDWRKTSLAHCTLKLISRHDAYPESSLLEDYAHAIGEIVAKCHPFEVRLGTVGSFPTAVYAKVDAAEAICLHKKLCDVLPSGRPQYEGENYVPHVSIAMTEETATVDPGIPLQEGFMVNEVSLIVWFTKDLLNSVVYRKFSLGKD